ncbi:hypothetical protein GW746_00480 [Candidatus Saccharibacteria bacterium]|nr:hypothetical protein [Candidatus Saccharibacteria bacterium]NCS82881.1 hypothetical protein [Candidatus Saccharibacteria bacterium]
MEQLPNNGESEKLSAAADRMRGEALDIGVPHFIRTLREEATRQNNTVRFELRATASALYSKDASSRLDPEGTAFYDGELLGFRLIYDAYGETLTQQTFACMPQIVSEVKSMTIGAGDPPETWADVVRGVASNPIKLEPAAEKLIAFLAPEVTPNVLYTPYTTDGFGLVLYAAKVARKKDGEMFEKQVKAIEAHEIGVNWDDFLR